MRSGATSDHQLSFVDADEACNQAGIDRHTVRFTSTVLVADRGSSQQTLRKLEELVRKGLQGTDYVVSQQDGEISVSSSVLIKIEENAEEEELGKEIVVSWAHHDDHLGETLLELVKNIGK